MINLIGVSGKKQVGKDTFYQIFNKYIHNYKNMKFADNLKKICSNLSKEPLVKFYEHKYYNDILPLWNMTIREFQQFIGSELRNSDYDIWVNSLLKNFDNKRSKWVITDVRFENEVEMIKRNNGMIVRIERDNVDENDITSLHISETALDNYTKWDCVIYNNGNIQDYELKIKDFIQKFS